MAPVAEQVRAWTWGWLAACQLTKGVLATVICLGLWGAVPALIGWLPTTVSSGSMLPRLHVGDVAVSRPLQGTAPTVGSVLLFDDPDHPDRLRLHRFVRIDDDGLLVTRGDANNGEDSSPVTLGAVHGVGTLRVPWVGLPVVWIRERSWIPLGLSALVLTGLTAIAAQSRKFGFPGPDQPTAPPLPDSPPPPDSPPSPDSPGPPDPAEAPSGDAAATTENPRPTEVGPATPARTHPRPAQSLTAAAAVLVLLWVPTVPAGAAFSDSTGNRDNAAAAATYFRCANAVAAVSPYLWFRMDETSSTTTIAADSSRNDRDGVYGAGGKTSTTGRACARDTGRAMRFDGSSGYLSSVQIYGTAPNTFTEAVWFKTTSRSGGKLIGLGNVQTGPSGVFDRHVYLTNTGRLIFGVYTNATKTITSPGSYSDGEWHHVVATLSSAGMRLYLDGELVASDPGVTTAEPVSSGFLRFGYDNLDGWPSAPTSRFFSGTLDDATFYLTALSAKQIAAQYEAGT